MPRARLLSRNSDRSQGSLLSRIVLFFTGGENWTYRHLTVFLLTFFSFAFLHASRKTLSTVKGSLIELWTNNHTEANPLFPDQKAAESFLAVLDCGFFAAYAFGLYIGGMLGDRYNPAKVLSIGMCLSAGAVLVFGAVTEWLHLYSKIFYAVVWIIGGLFQSTGWPTEICILGNWFGHGSRGAVLGLWSSCASVGNILGTLISYRVIHYGYQYAFACNAALTAIGGVCVAAFLYSAPRELGLPDPPESQDEIDRVIEEVSERPKAINFWRAWLLPGVISYSLAYACLKMVNYSFFLWLPFYLHDNFGWDESKADALSTWYDLGGIIAAVLAGIASDHFPSRTPLVVVMLLMSMGAIFAYANSPKDIFINSLLMALTGFFIGGPANLISSTISADLGKAQEIRGSSEALSTVTGIVDGTGSVGASVGQLLLPVIQNAAGWTTVFYSFILMMFCTLLCLVPLLWKEIRDQRRYHYEVLPEEGTSPRLLDAAEGLHEDDALLTHSSTNHSPSNC